MRYIELFCDLEKAKLEELKTSLREEPQERLAQKTLARELTALVHGRDLAANLEGASELLFKGEVSKLDSKTLKEIHADLPSVELSGDDLPKLSLVELFSRAFAVSKGEVRRILPEGGVYLNYIRVENRDRGLSPEDFIDGDVLLIRMGKKRRCLVLLVED